MKKKLNPTKMSLPRDAMRAGATDEELLGLIGPAVKAKKKQHAGDVWVIFFLEEKIKFMLKEK